MNESTQDYAGRVSLILFVLGSAGVPPSPPLPAPALVALLGDLGLSEGAARSAILRLRRGGWLETYRAGRSVAYAPSDRTVAGHRRRTSSFTGPRPTWDGWFHALLVSVPERQRAFRDELRRAARIAGYGTVHAGLLIAPTDRRDEIGDLLTRVPPGATVMPGRFELAPADTRRVARELWSLDQLAIRYRSLAARTRAATGSAGTGQLAGPEAFRAFADATLPIYEAVAADPGLPEELLPPQWPAPRLGAALGHAIRAFGPAVEAHVDDRRHQAAGKRVISAD